MSTPEVKAILKRKRALALTANNNGDTVYGTPGRGKKAKAAAEREAAKSREAAGAAARARAAFVPSAAAAAGSAGKPSGRAGGDRGSACSSTAERALRTEQPLLSEVPPHPRHVWVADETLEEWAAVGGGGFERARLGYHPGTSCDRTGAHPIVGVRYQLAPPDLLQQPEAFNEFRRRYPYGYDLCEEAYWEAPPAERARYVAVPPPVHASDVAPLLQPLRRHFAYSSSEPRCGGPHER